MQSSIEATVIMIYQTACTVAAVGTTTRMAVVLRTGSPSTPQESATAISASASLLSQFNDWIILFLDAEQRWKRINTAYGG